MGYMGLKNVGEVDDASGLLTEMKEAMLEVLKEGIKEKGDGYNPSGVVNVALIFEQYICTTDIIDGWDHGWIRFANQVVRGLNREINEAEDHSGWEDQGNRRDHLRAYKRMHKMIVNWLERLKDA